MSEPHFSGASVRAESLDATTPAPSPAAHGAGSWAGARCANCGQLLAGAYCHSCGQTAHLHRSLTHLGEELLHGVLHFDTRGVRTLPLLIARPGLLTRRYIDGQRTRYVAPLVLFLFCMFLLYLTWSLVRTPATRLDPAQRAAALTEMQRQLNGADAQVARAGAALAAAERAGSGIDAARAALSGARTEQRVDEATLRAVQIAEPAGSGTVPSAAQWLAAYANAPIDTGSARLDRLLRQIVRQPELFFFKFRTEAYKLSFLLIPISLPFLWLLFIGRRDVAVYDHAVFSLYSLSFMSLLLIAVVLMGRLGLSLLPALLLLLAPPVHMYAQLRGTYALGIGAALWRTVALLVVAGTVFTSFVLFMVVIASG